MKSSKLTSMMALAALCITGSVPGAMTIERGAWRIAFDETTSVLSLANPSRKVSIEGRFACVSDKPGWKVVESRDAATDRLALANSQDVVLGYISFRSLGELLEMTVFHRAGANFFPGRLVFDGTAKVREISFACRTIPTRGEQVLNFADGAGDSPLNDSVFAREEDLAVRFFSDQTRLDTKGGGEYAVHLEADIDDPAAAAMAIEVDARYYASRWAPVPSLIT